MKTYCFLLLLLILTLKVEKLSFIVVNKQHSVKNTFCFCKTYFKARNNNICLATNLYIVTVPSVAEQPVVVANSVFNGCFRGRGNFLQNFLANVGELSVAVYPLKFVAKYLPLSVAVFQHNSCEHCVHYFTFLS